MVHFSFMVMGKTTSHCLIDSASSGSLTLSNGHTPTHSHIFLSLLKKQISLLQEELRISKMASLKPYSLTLLIFTVLIFSASANAKQHSTLPLRFGQNGQFKILQVADMHYADGKTTPCLDVFPDQLATCSDLNTTAFLERVIQAEKPDLVVFTGISHALIFLFVYPFFCRKK